MAETYEYADFKVTFLEQYIAHVEINRPEKLNSFTDSMFNTIGAIFTRLSTSPDVRVILLSGAGPKAFTAGLDVTAASQGPVFSPSSTRDAARIAFSHNAHIAHYQACVSAIEKCTKPVIALLHGYSYGMAIDLSTACDVRLCVADAAMCVKEVDIGIAADVGTLSRLPKVVGSASWIKDVCLTARVFGAEEALQQGFVSRVLASKEEGVEVALGLARVIASKSPVAVVGTKELLNYSRDRTVEEGLKYTAVWNAAMLQTEDVKKAIFSGLKKGKTPTFEKL
ncbi:delta-delta-dienoyl-CoA isomerase [Pseudovirgaria hyperparasitica]|uniref:Delta-delta-dienoyl-CoA isomerase n=1 Tax=Pseudovirgaria hyperparasitica TaxID=470096 RepID=A0A6A6W7K5_9PEZI|nr:delta-delta-dienoyl-CoA isomerase [Pseudovirgaria hyperparasitica]KAF2758525.1 delta-delta-dienoyl-CoA isomerase [Pseudovirgaria hyperparasitica]